MKLISHDIDFSLEIHVMYGYSLILLFYSFCLVSLYFFYLLFFCTCHLVQSIGQVLLTDYMYLICILTPRKRVPQKNNLNRP